MNWLKGSGPFYILFTLGFWVLVFTILDITFKKNLMVYLIGAYCLIIFLLIVLFWLKSSKKELVTFDTVEEFEKTLSGGLFHFKCPTCNGIFAIKKSKENNKKPIKMTCPDCGSFGVIQSRPLSIEEFIPEKKSTKAVFRCNICGEGISIWAEGTNLHSNTQVFTCPFCGGEKTINRI